MTSVKSTIAISSMLVIVLSFLSAAQDLSDISLPAPNVTGGKPLMQALKLRQSQRSFGAKKLPVQTVSDLLWAAFGINRPDSGKRTAPSTRNWQEVDIYAIMEDGAYLYDAKANKLKVIAKGDLRKLTGSQKFVVSAPLNLVFTADTAKMKGGAADERQLYMGADVAFISQNVYLFCASEGLGTVVRGSVDRAGLTKALNLPAEKRIIFAQTVGYPEAESH
ncbi:MAG TPA: nitroreductase family protein [Chitinivibrionales bacterium]|nr:nitroreductase family protein [Chitinivibrionales bacterium]